MTTITPFVTAQVVSLSSSRIYAGKGYVEKIGNDGQLTISSSSGKMTVQLTSGNLVQGDYVAFKVTGNEIFMERIAYAAPEQSLTDDLFELFPHNNHEDIQSMVKGLAEKISNNPISSNTQDELAGALTLLEKELPDFDPQVRAVAQEIIKFTSTVINSNSSENIDLAKCADLLKKLSSCMQSAATPAVTSFPIAAQAESPAEGFYYFDSLTKALSWTQTNGAQIEEKDIRQLNALLGKSPVVVQIYNNGYGLQYSVMSMEKAAAEIQSFIQNNLTSTLGKELTQDLLMLLMIQRGNLPVNRLMEVDALFPDTGMESFFLQEPGKSAWTQSEGQYGIPFNKNQAIALEQWLNIVCDPKTPLNILPGHVPLFSSTSIPEMFETATSMQASGTSAFTGLNVTDFTITDSLLNTNETKGQVIPSIISKMGINLENSLSALSSDDTTGIMSPNLKSSLLTALNEFQNEIIAKNVASMEILQQALSPVTNQIQQLAAQKDLPITQQTPNGLNILLREVNAKINDWVTAADSMVTESITGTAGQTKIPPVNTLLPDVSNSPLSQSAGKTSDGMTARIDALTRAAVKQMFMQLETFSNGISSQIQKLPELQANQVSNEAMNDIFNAIKAMSAQLERTARGIPWRIDRVIMEATRLLDANTKDTPDKAANASPDTMNRRLEAMLSRVESLQLLAKPVATSQGEQHVLMLPMKIDGKWDDVIVKFVKDGHTGNNKAAKKNISVMINVAPTFLGEINTTLEYSPQRDLKMCMNFASERTKSWFEKNRQDFTDAVGKQDFKSLHIVLKKMPRPEKALNASPVSKADEGCIDIVA